MSFDIFGIDNALVDIFIQVNDDELATLPLEKGHSNILSDEKIGKIHNHISNSDAQVTPGGSVANTLNTAAQLGATTVFCDAVGNDAYGDLYEKNLKTNNIASRLARSGRPTGTATTFVTPDAERTFAVHLGSCLALRKSNIPEEDVAASKVLYVASYVLEDPQLREAAVHAMEIAKKNNNTVAIDLSDPGFVERNLETIKHIVTEYVDILFANEPEAAAFTGTSPEAALLAMSELVDIAIVKLGAEGSLIKQGNKITKVAAHVVEAVDTTGAGDAYAAGFLYGWLNGHSLQVAGDLGSLLAAKVICHLGARLEQWPKEEITLLLATPHE